MIEAVKAHSPLRAELQAAGLHLERDRVLCPFHPDKHPSLTVKGERWKCWSCGESGDVIDFTAKYHGIDTRAAIKLLADRAGISTRQTPAEVRAAEKARRMREERRKLVEAFREWERKRADELACILRTFRQSQARGFKEAEIEILVPLIKQISEIEWVYEQIFCRADDEPKLELFRREMGSCP